MYSKDQYNVRSSVVDPLPWFSVANLKFVYTDYKHDELDGNKVGATFNEIGSIRASNSCGTSRSAWSEVRWALRIYKELSVLGGEAFLQPTQTLAAAGFLFEEVKLTQD